MPANDRSRPRSGSKGRGSGAGKGSSSGSAGRGDGPKRGSSAKRPSGNRAGTSGGRGSGGRPASGKGRRPSSGKDGGRSEPREAGRTAGPKQWGSLGRKGAGRLTAEDFDARGGVGSGGNDRRPPAPDDGARWVRVDDVRDEASGAVARGRSQPERRGRRPRPAGAGSGGAQARRELEAALGQSRGARANERLREAVQAFERERYGEARTLLKPLAEQAPQAMAVRELLGLTYYRLGRWRDAVHELEAFRQGTGTTEQHPVLADCYRAQGKHRQVEELWEELREASPSPDLVAEGRIVAAGSRADQGDLAGAIALLDRGRRLPSSPQVHHLRMAYALADLHERAGDAARARELFRWVAGHEADFADAAERAAALG